MAKPGRPKKVIVVPKQEGNLSAAQIKMLSGGGDEDIVTSDTPDVVTIPKSSTVKPKTVAQLESSEKRRFVRELAVASFMELIKHNGKINNDWSDIVTREARALADKLDF